MPATWSSQLLQDFISQVAKVKIHWTWQNCLIAEPIMGWVDCNKGLSQDSRGRKAVGRYLRDLPFALDKYKDDYQQNQLLRSPRRDSARFLVSSSVLFRSFRVQFLQEHHVLY